jgi:hypothetical protein
VPAIAVAAVVALYVVAIHAPTPPAPPTAQDAVPSAAASPLPEPAPSLHRAGNACQSDLTVPTFSGGPRPRGTGLRLLVGDRNLQVVNVDLGTSRVLSTIGRGLSVTELHQAGSSVLAVTHTSCGAGVDDGEVGILDPLRGDIVSTGRGDSVLPGTPTTVVAFDGGGEPRVRALHGPGPSPLPHGWVASAASGPDLVVSATSSDPHVPATIGIGNPATGRLTRTFGKGYVVAAAPGRAVWLAGECHPGPCLLTVTGPDTFNSAVQARSFPCCGTFSPDGRRVAFILPRTDGELGPHPGPPADVAVLDVTTMSMRILPGLLLPPKTFVTTAWSPDSTWLVLGADLGTRPLVLVWRESMSLPAEVRVPALAGGTTGPPALLVLPDQSLR